MARRNKFSAILIFIQLFLLLHTICLLWTWSATPSKLKKTVENKRYWMHLSSWVFLVDYNKFYCKVCFKRLDFFLLLKGNYFKNSIKCIVLYVLFSGFSLNVITLVLQCILKHIVREKLNKLKLVRSQCAASAPPVAAAATTRTYRRHLENR